MIENKNHLLEQKISTVLFVTDVKPVSEKLSVDISGDLQVYIGEGRVPPQRKTYQARFDNSNGRLMLIGFEEVLLKAGEGA